MTSAKSFEVGEAGGRLVPGGTEPLHPLHLSWLPDETLFQQALENLYAAGLAHGHLHI